MQGDKHWRFILTCLATCWLELGVRRVSHFVNPTLQGAQWPLTTTSRNVPRAPSPEHLAFISSFPIQLMLNLRWLGNWAQNVYFFLEKAVFTLTLQEGWIAVRQCVVPQNANPSLLSNCFLRFQHSSQWDNEKWRPHASFCSPLVSPVKPYLMECGAYLFPSCLHLVNGSYS